MITAKLIYWLIAAFFLTLPAQTFVSYSAIMNWKYRKDKLTTWSKPFVFFYVFVIGYPQDILLRFTWGVLLFWEIPPLFSVTFTVLGKEYTVYYPEITFTQLVTRHQKGPDGWRKDLANWCCANWLDPFDLSGLHCKH